MATSHYRIRSSWPRGHASRKATTARAMSCDREGNRDEKDAIAVAMYKEALASMRMRHLSITLRQSLSGSETGNIRPGVSGIRHVGTRFVPRSFVHTNSSRVH